MVKGLTSPELLLCDYANSVDEMLTRLREFTHCDAWYLIARVNFFRERAKKLATLLANDVDDYSVHNASLIRIGRAQNSVYYTTTGPYDQDTNELIPRFPGIAAESALQNLDPDSDDARFLSVRLRRDENRIAEGIESATEIADQLLH